MIEKTKKFRFGKIKFVVIAVAVSLIAGIALGFYLNREKDEGPLPEAIREELVEVSKLGAYEFNYEGIIPICDSREVGDIKIPLTESRYFATIDGRINIGIKDCERIEFHPKEKDGAVSYIKIKIPKSTILDNYTMDETLEEIHKHNNVLNPIDVEDYNKKIVKLEKDQAAKVKKEGLLEKCDERIQSLMTAHIKTLYGENVEVEFEYLD